MKKERYFNLLKPIESPKSAWDKIYDWIIGKARIVLLSAEIVMVVIFFAKVVVDNIEKNKLEEFDTVQQELVNLESQYEEEFRQVQARVIDYQNLWQNSSNIFPIYNEVISYIDNPSSQFSLSISSSGTVTIEGYEQLVRLKKIETLMKASDSFDNVTINTLSLEQSDVVDEKGRYSLTGQIDSNLLLRDPI
ncbi:hypothetical protein KC678_05400 [Candidatus Dojkabacteria bacterium]|uniref:PilN domain-containing protein n=1 Tax=Candidatus Dojkabacteria bacterium TaxID=2099670 RepID=A0A955L2T4_9BACT|nr:hypothetical protein [Candidatus Dojkabacteria bacterium]